jgi:hypothetical protein
MPGPYGAKHGSQAVPRVGITAKWKPLLKVLP